MGLDRLRDLRCFDRMPREVRPAVLATIAGVAAALFCGACWRSPTLAVVAGLVAAAVAVAVIRMARPRWGAPLPPSIGPFPWRRLAVTLSAPLAILVLSRISLPGVNMV